MQNRSSKPIGKVNSTSKEKPPIPQRAKKRGKPTKNQSHNSHTVSPEARRRASLLSNRKMKYVISRSSGQKHDRDCSCVAYIPDHDFDMVEVFPGWDLFCWRCAKRAAIREGMTVDIIKHLDAAVMLLGKMNAASHLVQDLFCKHGGKIFRIEPDCLFIKVNEDSWIIQYTPEGCLLHHNNYYLIDPYTRLISEGYHQQYESPLPFHVISSMIINYSWEKHVRQKKEEERAARQRELENRLTGIVNYVRIPIFSFFCNYIQVADCNNYIERESRRENLHANVVLKGCYPGTKCTDAFFRVRKKDYRRFLDITAEAKSYSVRSKNFDYADFCEKKIAQQLHGTTES